MKRNNAMPVRAVLADDDPIVHEVLRNRLQASALEIVGEAFDGSEAVSQVRTLQPDVVFLDLLMPAVGGMQALRSLTTDSGSCRAVILCSSINNLQMVEALQLGARGILPKKNLACLLPCIEAVMAGHYWIGDEWVTNVFNAIQKLIRETDQGHKQKVFNLTAREIELIAHLSEGRTNKEIAAVMEISEDTVKPHLTNIFDKTGASSRLELAVFAIEHSLVTRAQPRRRLAPLLATTFVVGVSH